jgi:hypothetical protein
MIPKQRCDDSTAVIHDPRGFGLLTAAPTKHMPGLTELAAHMYGRHPLPDCLTLVYPQIRVPNTISGTELSTWQTLPRRGGDE